MRNYYEAKLGGTTGLPFLDKYIDPVVDKAKGNLEEYMEEKVAKEKAKAKASVLKYALIGGGVLTAILLIARR